MPSAKYRHFGCRIIDQSKYKDMRVVFLENELIRVGILLDKGADIFQFLHKPTDIDFMWRSPQGLINPKKYRETIANPSGSFLDNYHGGWQEILPGGGPTNYKGASIGLHGEITQLGWDFDILIDEENCVEIALFVTCVRTPFHIEKRVKLNRNEARLHIHEIVTNLSPQSLEFMWGHHPAFGSPFLNENVKLFMPAAKAKVHEPKFAPSGKLKPGFEFDWPTYQTKGFDLSHIPSIEAGFSELIYLYEMSDSWYALIDSQKKIGFGLAWEKEIFPYIWFWCVYGSFPGYPWWDQVYVVALEPWTSFPNDLEQVLKTGKNKVIEGGGVIETRLCATVIVEQEAITSIDLNGKIN